MPYPNISLHQLTIKSLENLGDRGIKKGVSSNQKNYLYILILFDPW